MALDAFETWLNEQQLKGLGYSYSPSALSLLSDAYEAGKMANDIMSENNVVMLKVDFEEQVECLRVCYNIINRDTIIHDRLKAVVDIEIR